MTRTLAPGDLNLGHNLNGALVLRRLNETDSMSVSQRGVTGARHVWAVGHLAPKHAVMDAAVGRRGRALDRLARQGMYVVAMELTIATPLAKEPRPLPPISLSRPATA